MASTYLRKKVTNNFTTLSNELIRDKNLSWKSTGFLIYLLSCADNWELNFSDLKNRKKDGKSSTQAAADELKAAGYLKIEKVRNEKGQIVSFDWVVSDKPYMENPYMDNPDMENQPQIKTNPISTSLNKKQQQPAAEAAAGSSGLLIFDKSINQNLRQKLAGLLADVDSNLAQQMLDVLVSLGDKARYPLKLMKRFVENQDDFDPTPGLVSSRKRENERLAVEKRKLEAEKKNRPFKNPAVGKIKLVDLLKEKP